MFARRFDDDEEGRRKEISAKSVANFGSQPLNITMSELILSCRMHFIVRIITPAMKGVAVL